MTAEGQSDKMTSDMEVRVKQRCVIEFLRAEKKRVLPSGKISESMNMSYRYHVVCCVSCRSCMYWKRISLTSLPSRELATVIVRH